MSNFDLPDDELNVLRTEAKVRTGSTRLKKKNQYMEQHFDLVSRADPKRAFFLYRRHHPRDSTIFSVGLSVELPAGRLTLCRYNGSYHGHRNQLEGNRFQDAPHIHLATQRYLVQGSHPDGFAEPTTRFLTVDNALRCLVIDCNIDGVVDSGDSDPFSADLEFGP